MGGILVDDFGVPGGGGRGGEHARLLADDAREGVGFVGRAVAGSSLQFSGYCTARAHGT